MNKRPALPGSWTYFLLGVLLWAIVDWGTAGGFRMAYFEKYLPALLLFYIGFPLIFSVLIFRFHWGGRLLFSATLVTIFLVEGVVTRNRLLIAFPALLWGIPLSILVYAPPVYFPLWAVRGEVRRHWRLMLVLSGVTLTIMILTTFITGGAAAASPGV
jgi:hypothetical protein